MKLRCVREKDVQREPIGKPKRRNDANIPADINLQLPVTPDEEQFVQLEKRVLESSFRLPLALKLFGD